MSAPNIQSERARCTMDCRKAPWIEVRDAGTGKLLRNSQGQHDEGDVRRCKHDRIWYCIGGYSGGSYSVSGYWMQLHPVWNFLRYRRAVRAFEAEARRPRIVIEPLSVAR